MTKARPWLCRAAFALMGTLCALWCVGEASQWFLRVRAQQMLADFRSIQMGQRSSAQTDTFFRKWSRKGHFGQRCDGETCTQSVYVSNWLPAPLLGDPNDGAPNWIPMAIDLTGLRPAGVGAEITVARGIVTEKNFDEYVGLPVRDFYVRGAILAMSSVEHYGFQGPDQGYTNPSHPFRTLHWTGGAYGLSVRFTSEETEAEKRALMAFQFSCITRMFPCRSVGEILPEAERLQSEAH
jgi:hypothetical protein